MSLHVELLKEVCYCVWTWRMSVIGGGLVGGGVSLHVDLLKEVHHCVWTCLGKCVTGEGLVGEGVPLGVDFEDSKGLYHSLYLSLSLLPPTYKSRCGLSNFLPSLTLTL